MHILHGFGTNMHKAVRVHMPVHRKGKEMVYEATFDSWDPKEKSRGAAKRSEQQQQRQGGAKHKKQQQSTVSSYMRASSSSSHGSGSEEDIYTGNRVVVRKRLASTAWERMVSIVVGNPVHLDVVLLREGCSAGKFCFSAYMGQPFEVCMMNRAMIMDETMSNVYIDVSDEEYERCMSFMMALVEKKTRYDYFDAMVLMPMAPKSSTTTRRSSFSSQVINTLVEDADSRSPEGIKRVFCSQSVVLMLRHALNPYGAHGKLLEHINSVNSKLVSPKQVVEMLVSHGAEEMCNEELALLALDVN